MKNVALYHVVVVCPQKIIVSTFSNEALMQAMKRVNGSHENKHKYEYLNVTANTQHSQ